MGSESWKRREESEGMEARGKEIEQRRDRKEIQLMEREERWQRGRVHLILGRGFKS